MHSRVAKRGILAGHQSGSSQAMDQFEKPMQLLPVMLLNRFSP
jgi:hypothetical protein